MTASVEWPWCWLWLLIHERMILCILINIGIVIIAQAAKTTNVTAGTVYNNAYFLKINA